MSVFLANIRRTIRTWFKSQFSRDEIVREYGIIAEEKRGGAFYNISLLPCRRKGKLYLGIKTTWFAYISAGYRYELLPATAAPKLREVLDDLEALERQE
jgi:hypothetical protein